MMVGCMMDACMMDACWVRGGTGALAWSPLPRQPSPPAVFAPPSVSFSASTLGPLESLLQGLDLLLAPVHLLQKAVLHQPGDFKYGSLEDRFHDTGKLGLEMCYSLSHHVN